MKKKKKVAFQESNLMLSLIYFIFEHRQRADYVRKFKKKKLHP